MRITLLVVLIGIATCRGAGRYVRQSSHNFEFDNELPEDVDLSRIAEQPVKYHPFTYNKKYFHETAADTSFTYDYNSPKSPPIWARSFPNCGGQKQSPINIQTQECVRSNLISPLRNLQPDLEPRNVIMENNGHSVEFTFEYSGARPMLSGGPLRSTYIFEQLHFHWGMAQGEGSEHYVDSQPGELELHVVHRNAKYSNITEAARNSDGIVVIGVLYKSNNDAPPHPFMRNLDELRMMNSSVTRDNFPRGFRMNDIIGPFSQDFIAYQGSLTTPPCAEAVSWLVSREMQMISPRDLESFRGITGRNGRAIAPNNRPLQNRNNRLCLVF